MNQSKKVDDANKVTLSQKQDKERWLGNPDDHEPTKKVKQAEINP